LLAWLAFNGECFKMNPPPWQKWLEKGMGAKNVMKCCVWKMLKKNFETPNWGGILRKALL